MVILTGRRWWLWGGMLAVLACLTVSWLWYAFCTTPLLTTIDTTSPALVSLAPGMSTRTLANELQKQHLITNPRFFILLARITGLSHRLQAGVYQINSQDTALTLLYKMSDGNVAQASVTLVDGWTLSRVIEQLNNTAHLKHTIDNVEQIPPLLRTSHQNAEGLFYPDTYKYDYGSSDKDILKRAHDKLWQVLQQVWAQRSHDVPYTTPYQLLIAASVIEKETSHDDEKALVSSVIVNRLKKGMRLQMDPTVIYGLGQHYRGRLSRDDLRRDTPYNTYRRRGLPPTPIALVGWTSLWAAAHPRQSNYLYFVAKGDSRHHFSSDLSEQRRAIERYIFKSAKMVTKALEK